MGNAVPQDVRRRDAQAEKAVSRTERNPMAESKQSEKFYLERFGVTDRELLAAMGRVKVRDVDYADLYFEHTVDESISMEESLVKRASKSVSQGVGVRATAGEKTGYAEENGQRQAGSFGGGGRGEYTFFLEDNRWERYAKEAARQAVLNLKAVDAPAGPMVVVLGSGWPGILLHEAIGHGLEADFNRKKTSAFTDRIGQAVGSQLCTIVDDGTLPFRRGSLNVDDEGTPTSRTVLIEGGILRGYITDKLNARLMGIPLTGNGRRESFQCIPMPRMTNTFMLPGKSTPEEIIRSVKHGLYAVYFGGGQVDITNGKFVFSASDAYLIEDGQVTTPVKGATLIGSGPEILKKVSMVGNDLQLDEGIGTCGKDGQSVPVGVGLPTIRVDEITVGGTQA